MGTPYLPLLTIFMIDSSPRLWIFFRSMNTFVNLKGNPNDEDLLEVYNQFQSLSSWWSAVFFLLDTYPSTLHKLNVHDSVISEVLDQIWRVCKLWEMFKFIKGKPDIISSKKSKPVSVVLSSRKRKFVGVAR